MKRINFTFVIILMPLLTLALYSCSQEEELSSPEQQVSTISSAEEQEAIELATTVEYLNLLTPEVKAKRKAAIILSEYVAINGNQYFLDITMEEAAKLVITEELYKSTLKNLENGNTAIKEATKKGEKVQLIDIKELKKTYK